jgi:hypothetical protein
MSPTVVQLVDQELARVRGHIAARLRVLQNTPEPDRRIVHLHELDLLVARADCLAFYAEEYS